MNPVRDWWLGLLVALLIFVVSAVWSSYVYTKHRDMSVAEVAPADTAAVVYREAMVKSALQYFSEKDKRHQELIRFAQGTNNPTPVDEVETTESNASQATTTTTSPITSTTTTPTVGEPATEDLIDNE
jgi:hypothetical protein